MNLDHIRDGLKVRLESIPGMRGRVHKYVPTKVNAPCAIISLGAGEADQDFAGNYTVMFAVLYLVPKGDATAAQRKLDAWLSPGLDASIQDALYDSPTLPRQGTATVSDLSINGWTSPASYTVGGSDYLGVEVEVEVIA